VKQTRNVGCFGCIDVQKNRRGEWLAPVNQPHPALGAFNADLRQRGLFTMMRGANIFTNPPLIIDQAEIEKGFAILDQVRAFCCAFCSSTHFDTLHTISLLAFAVHVHPRRGYGGQLRQQCSEERRASSSFAECRGRGPDGMAVRGGGGGGRGGDQW
jgi:hypothetical protein